MASDPRTVLVTRGRGLSAALAALAAHLRSPPVLAPLQPPVRRPPKPAKPRWMRDAEARKKKLQRLARRRTRKAASR